METAIINIVVKRNSLPIVLLAIIMRSWLSWIECLTTNQKVGGSSPSGRVL